MKSDIKKIENMIENAIEFMILKNSAVFDGQHFDTFYIDKGHGLLSVDIHVTGTDICFKNLQIDNEPIDLTNLRALFARKE